MINVVSFSGGRTSAYLLWLMEQKRQAGEDVYYVFMDTGAEHLKHMSSSEISSVTGK